MVTTNWQKFQEYKANGLVKDVFSKQAQLDALKGGWQRSSDRLGSAGAVGCPAACGACMRCRAGALAVAAALAAALNPLACPCICFACRLGWHWARSVPHRRISLGPGSAALLCEQVGTRCKPCTPHVAGCVARCRLLLTDVRQRLLRHRGTCLASTRRRRVYLTPSSCSPLGIFMIHNGNLTNCDQLRQLLNSSTSFFNRHMRTDSDSEVRAAPRCAAPRCAVLPAGWGALLAGGRPGRGADGVKPVSGTSTPRLLRRPMCLPALPAGAAERAGG